MKLNNKLLIFLFSSWKKAAVFKETGLVSVLSVILPYRHFMQNKQLFVLEESIQSPKKPGPSHHT